MKRNLIAIMVAVAVLLTIAGCSPKTGESGVATSGALSDDNAAIDKFTESLINAAGSDFTLTDLNGREWTLSGLKGKVVLLNFWATWCPPCQREMPGFQSLHERMGDDGEVIVLTVASAALEQMGEEESKKAVSEFIKEQNYTFPVLYDPTGEVWAVYQQEGIPANYIIDKQGNVRFLMAGAFSSEDEMNAALEAVRRADSGQ